MKLFGKIFKSNTTTAQADLTTIIRTETFEGFSIPGIIHNMHYHFTDLQVYEDGLVSCWEMVDLQMFKDKLKKGWIVTSIPNGEMISIFNLGSWNIDRGKWQYTKETFYEHIFSLVKRLNPTLENLHNYKGENSKIIGNLNVAKHSIPDAKPYYLDASNRSFYAKKIPGEKFHFFYRNDDTKTYLVQLSLYKNGNIEITNLPVKKTFKFEKLSELVEKQILTTELEAGETITILNLGSFDVTSGSGVNIKSKVTELTDKLNELNGRENSISKCARIFEEYKQTPTRKLRSELKAAYESVPEHQRIFIGTMDTKDYEIRHIIYGDIVKKEWEEYYGYEYPFNDMPKPIDE